MSTATFTKSLSGFRGDVRLYKLDPPLCYDTYVIVSAIDNMFSGPETYIFPASSDGQVLSWGELEGSLRGVLDHAKALEAAGYEVV